MIRALAHAKINLRHRVFARDETGFHGVETILLRTSLTDDVGIEETAHGVSIAVDGPASAGVPEGPANLCCLAAEKFLARAFARRKVRPGIHITLTKRIPAASGLGGGSADAAATLQLLSKRWGKLNERDLVSISGELGSDVTFALVGVPMALGWERGRRLLPLRGPTPRSAALVSPPIEISTPAAYEWLRVSRAVDNDGPTDPPSATGVEPADAPGHGGATVLPGPGRLCEWGALERIAQNDLEGPVLDRHPELADALDMLRGRDPAYAGMTGSGSTLFAIFSDEDECAEACGRIAPELAPGWILTEAKLPV